MNYHKQLRKSQKVSFVQIKSTKDHKVEIMTIKTGELLITSTENLKVNGVAKLDKKSIKIVKTLSLIFSSNKN